MYYVQNALGRMRQLSVLNRNNLCKKREQRLFAIIIIIKKHKLFFGGECPSKRFAIKFILVENTTVSKYKSA